MAHPVYIHYYLALKYPNTCRIYEKCPTDDNHSMTFPKLLSFFVVFLQVSGDCLTQSCQKISLDVHRDGMQDSEFVDHVFHNSVTVNQIQCYTWCVQDCRCLSLNYKGNNDQKYCELNEGNNFTNKSSLKQSHGSSSYILRRKVIITADLLFYQRSQFALLKKYIGLTV